MNGARILGTTDDVNTCDCCGRARLKVTVALVLDGAIDPVYFGTSCAARALRTGANDVRAAARAADDERRAEAEHARREAARVADAAWQAFLDARAPTHGSASRWPDRFRQIEELGGYAAARAAFVAAGGES